MKYFDHNRKAHAPQTLVLLAVGFSLLLACNNKAIRSQQPTTTNTTTNSTPDNTQRINVTVDRRVEVLCILFALAGAREYTNGPSTPYRAAMVRHFRPHANHPAVLATRALQSQGIGHDAPMRLAFYLNRELQPIRPLSAQLPGLSRFASVDIPGYLSAVRQFVLDTNFDAFLASQSDQRTRVEERFRTFISNKPILPFFNEIFGERTNNTYTLAPGMVSGLFSYGGYAERVDGGHDVVLVVSLDDLDSNGIPQPGDLALGLIIHETAHSYVNPLVEQRLQQIETIASRVIHLSAAQMQRQSYTTNLIVIQESVVRALVALYMRERVDEQHYRSQLQYEVSRGFIWTESLVNALFQARNGRSVVLSPEQMTTAVASGFEEYSHHAPTL